METTAQKKTRKTTKKKTTDVRKSVSKSGLDRKAALVEKMIQSIEERVDSKELRATLGDFIRLLQLQKELQEELPREIKVTWIEPSEKESVSET